MVHVFDSFLLYVFDPRATGKVIEELNKICLLLRVFTFLIYLYVIVDDI